MRSRLLRNALAFAACAATVLGIDAAPCRAAQAAGPKDGGTIVWLSEEPEQLNPYLEPNPVRGAFELLTSRGLSERGPDGRWIALLAVKIPDPKDGDVSPDLRTVTWKLRPGLLWSDGTELTSDDLRFTWEVCHNPDGGCTRDEGFKDIDRVDTPNAETIVLHYTRPYFEYKGQFRPGVLPRHSTDVGAPDAIAQWAWNRSLMPTAGPFTVLRWEPGDELVLYRNPHYYVPGRPYLHRINVAFRGDAPSAFQDLLKNTGTLLTWLPVPPGEEVLQAKAHGLVLGNGVTASLSELQLNLRDPTDVSRPHPILGDALVRRALLTGVNPAAMLASWNVPDLYSVTRITSPADLEPVHACHMAPLGFDPDAARRMLDEAGWSPGPGGIREKSGRRLELRVGFYTNADVSFGPVIAILRAELRVLGVYSDPQPVDKAELFSDWPSGSPLRQGDFDVMLYDWAPDRAGLEHDFDSFYASGSIPSLENPDGRNVNGIADPQIDAWLNKARSTLTESDRRDLYCRVADRVQNGLFAQEYLATIPNWPMSQPNLRGWQQNERYSWFGADVENWYLAP